MGNFNVVELVLKHNAYVTLKNKVCENENKEDRKKRKYY